MPSLSDSQKNCINTTRIENATLTELFDISKEILEQVSIPEGSVMLFGSVSHLARVGTSLYASDWKKLVAGLSGRWRGARVCPLIPLIGTDCPGSLSREITALSVWFSTIYEGSHLAMSDVWAGVVAAVEEFSTGATPLSTTETYKLPLPSSLNSLSVDMTATFCSIKSRPVVLNGFPKDKQNDLLWSLLDCLCSTFHVCNNPEDYLQRVITAPLEETKPKEKKVVLVGASNLGNCSDAFRQSGLEVVDLIVPGWLATPENVNKVVEQLKKLQNLESCKLVIDPFGNSTFRFEQFDGSSSLPYKIGGKYHMAGDITVVPSTAFNKQIDSVMPILLLAKNTHCVLVPPMPRYLFDPCCNNTTHCTNLGKQGYGEQLLSCLTSIRNKLIKAVNDSGLKRVRILDSCPSIELSVGDNTVSRIEKLRKVTAPDGIHFARTGYVNIVKNCVTCFSTIAARDVPSAFADRQRTHYWRGFKSLVGATALMVTSSSSGKGGRGGSHAGFAVHQHRGSRRGRRPFHPYRR